MAKNCNIKRNRNNIRSNSPTIDKDREYFRKKLSANRNADVRYWKNIKDLKEKFTYPFGCNQERCPSMKQRLDLHTREHHYEGLADALSVTPKPKTVRISKRISNTSDSTQTSSLQDQSEGTENAPVITTCVLRDPSLYKVDLDKTIMKWLQFVPIYPYTTDKKEIDNNVNSLINNINNLANDVKHIDYEINVKIVVDQFLNTPGMWYPNVTKDDQILMKDVLRNYLWKSIIEINENQFVNNRGDDNVIITNNNENEVNLNYVYSRHKNWDVRFSLNESKDGVEDEIRKWLKELKQTHKINNAKLNKKETVQFVLTCLTDLLDQQTNTTNYKTVLKRRIVDILNELQICSYYPKNRKIDIEKFAESLTNKIVTVQTKNNSFKINKSASYTVINKRNNMQILNIANGYSENNDLKHTLQDVVSECLDNGDDNNCSDIVEDTTDIIVKNLDCFKTNKENFVKAEISNLLRRSCDISIFQASNIAQQIVDIANDIVSHDDAVASTTGLVRPCLSGVISVYASANDSKQSKSPKPLASSTLKVKNAKTKKDIPKLNPEERSYGDKLLNLIKAWVNTLPGQFHMPKDKTFKETIIEELVGNIVEGAKLAQLGVPHGMSDQRKYITYNVLQWLQKFQICTDIDASTEQTNLLVDKVLTIPVPLLTRSQHGTRKVMKNANFGAIEKDPFIVFVPNVTHILEDEISIWMNEQPSDIYSTNDKSIRGKMVQELAAKVRTPLANKRPHNEISNEVAQWLSRIVKPGQKNNVRQLSENLKDRIVKLPQDQTLAATNEKRKQGRMPLHGSPPPVHHTNASVDDTEKTLMEFIGKYIEHNYNIDDPFARGAFTNLLKIEIIRLNPPTRKEVYDNFMKTGQRDYFSTERLDKELQYIKIVADWLKTIPLLPGHIVDNNFLAELTTTFAKEIYEIEDRRVIAPDEMDHDAYLHSIIMVNLCELPIDVNRMRNQMLEELMYKIIATRQTNQSEPCCKASATDTKKIYKKEEIANFIEDYVQENSKVLNEDEIKTKACSARVLKEIKQIVQETADPEILSKEKVYENLNEVPVPRDESIIRFNLALDYANEISEWIKNLPLLEVVNDPVERQALLYMISALAQKMVIRHYKKAANPMNTQVDEEIVNFLNKWISELPIEPQEETVYPILISQLTNRMKKIDMKLQGEKTNLEKIQQKINKSIHETRNTPQRKSKASISSKNLPPGKTGESLLVDAVEQWCNSLPIQGENDIETKAIKDNVAKNLYQKIGELNVDPRSHNDDLLFQEMVADEIDIQLENLPQNTDLQKNRDKLKATLLEAVMEAKKIMKATSAGDIYRHKLEKTIESSIPYPVQNQNHDPAFEIYKNRLAEEFILENFDHGNDAVKNNYVKRIKNEIDKYFQSAQNKNAIPLSKDQIYNELYSSLFKVPIPNENSIAEEVEEVKTKCEIEKWFQQLPLRPNTGAEELLEWDKILSILAKRIHEIEKTEPEPDEKVHKEIKKWLIQLPLLPGQEANVDQLTNNLQELLKITTKSRKFVPMPKDELFIPPKTNKINMDRVNKSRNIGVSKMEWPSRAGRKWVTSSNVFGQISCQVPPSTPRQMNSAQIMHTLVKAWCDNLPIKGNTIQEQVEACNLLDDLKSRIMLKISELNSSPAVLKDDIAYSELFDDALEDLLSTLPPNSELQQTKEERKFQLIQDILKYIPRVIEEKARQEYKEELSETVSGILGGPHNTTADMAAMFDKIKEEIVENFVELNYNKDDEEGKQAYKMLIHDAVLKYFSEIVQKWDNPSDILMKRNELICELSKIPIPSTAVLKEEVEEIRMKNEVRDFFDQLSLPEESKENMALRDQAKNNLAKMLNDIEKGGHNCSNDNKMKEEISRCLMKLKIQVDPEVINAFVNKLKNDETERKAPPPRKESETVLSPCQAVQGNVPLCTRAALPSNSRGSGAGVVLSSSVGQLGASQQIPIVAGGSIHRSMLSTSVLQPVQVPANEVVVPQVSQPVPCQQTVPCSQPIPNVPPVPQLLSTVQTSSVGQRSDTAPTTGIYERQPMAQASEPNRWRKDIRPEATRETRPGHRQDRPRSRPSSEEDEECICESRKRPRIYRNRPPCYYPRDYYGGCEDMMPPWWGMLHPCLY